MELDFEIVIGNKTFKNPKRAFHHMERQLVKNWDGQSQKISNDLKKALERVANIIKQKHGRSYSSTTRNPKSSPLMKRSGEGVKSVIESVRVKSSPQIKGYLGQISAGKLSFHEYGGVITPKTSKYLTIPLPAALRGDGTPIRKKARDWDNTFVMRSKKGNLIIFRKVLAGKIVPLYVLKKRVKIPPRLGMTKTVDEQLNFFEKQLLERLDEAFWI